MKTRISSTTNIANVAPIGAQYPDSITKSYEALATDSPEMKPQMAKFEVPARGTLAATDVNLIAVQNRIITPDEATSSNVTGETIRSVFTGKGLPYHYVCGGIGIAPFGISVGDVKDMDDAYQTQLLDNLIDFYANPDLESQGSTLIAAIIAAVDNINVKVQNAFNRPLPLNTLSREDRFAYLANYEARLLQLQLIYERVSAVLSHTVRIAKVGTINTANIPGLYDPQLDAALRVIYNLIKGFPVLDVTSHGLVTRYATIYAANKRDLFPGASVGFNVNVADLNQSAVFGTVGTITAASLPSSKFFTSDATIAGMSLGLIDRAIAQAIGSDEGITAILRSLVAVCNNLLAEFTPVIQFFIQANNKGLYELKTLGEFLPYDDEGLIYYDIGFDQTIRTELQTMPVLLAGEVGSTNKTMFIAPFSQDRVGDTSLTLGGFPNPVRYVNPYTLAEDVLTDQEILTAGYYGIRSQDLTTRAFTAVNEMTGHTLSVSRVLPLDAAGTSAFATIPVVYLAGGVSLNTPLIPWDAPGNMNTADPTFNHTYNDFSQGLASKPTVVYYCAQIATTSTANIAFSLFAAQRIIDQFSLMYFVMPCDLAAGETDMDLLLTDFENDGMWVEISKPQLEYANSQFYAQAMNKVTWLEQASIKKARN